jgi:hypothetical protein
MHNRRRCSISIFEGEHEIITILYILYLFLNHILLFIQILVILI